ncbi:hypothetical protein TWF569_009103 [Orbilia oligospora]|nr:hypothetical protein TWF569_009103 [Orbilia oligospora]
MLVPRRSSTIIIGIGVGTGTLVFVKGTNRHRLLAAVSHLWIRDPEFIEAGAGTGTGAVAALAGVPGLEPPLDVAPALELSFPLFASLILDSAPPPLMGHPTPVAPALGVRTWFGVCRGSDSSKW